jgi:biotin-(acetyl-CoA carboxylase) ligase
VTLEHRYDAWLRRGLASLLDELEARNALRGHAVRVGGETFVAGRFAPDGRLTLERDDGTELLLASGEVAWCPT